MSSSDYSDSYDENKPLNLKKDLNTTDSESDNDDSGEKIVIKTFHPNKPIKKPTVPVNRFIRKPRMNVKIFDLRLDDDSSSEGSYYSYSYDEEDTNHEDHVKTKIVKTNIQNENLLEAKDLNEENESFVYEDKDEKNNQANTDSQIIQNQTENREDKIESKNDQKIENEKPPPDTNLSKQGQTESSNENEQINETQKDETNEIKIETNPIQNEQQKETETKGQIEVKKDDNDINSKQQRIDNKPDDDRKTEPKTKTDNDNDNDEEDEINPPIIKISSFQLKPLITYSIVRTLESSLLSKHYSYSFYLESLQKFYSKAKVKNTERQIPLFEGTTVDFKKKSSFELLVDKEFKSFTLKKSDAVLMSLKVCFDSLLILPRHIDIQIFTSPGISLTTKNPKMSTRGHWVLDFNGKFTIPSERNMIFVSAKEKEGADLIFVRQISNDEIDIDLCAEIDEIYVFAIAMSIFIARLS